MDPCSSGPWSAFTYRRADTAERGHRQPAGSGGARYNIAACLRSCIRATPTRRRVHANFRRSSRGPEAEASPVWWFGGGIGSHTVLRLRGVTRVHCHSTRQGRVRALRPGFLSARLKRCVRRVLHQAPRGAARHRRSLLRRLQRRWLRPLLRIRQERRRCYLTAYRRISRGASTTRTASASGPSNCCDAGASRVQSDVRPWHLASVFQSGGRTESILASLPPLVAWRWRLAAGARNSRGRPPRVVPAAARLIR